MRSAFFAALTMAASMPAFAQDASNCCAAVIVAGSESSALPPSTRRFQIWIEPSTSIYGWQPAFVDAVREGVRAWDRAALPVEFIFVEDSSAANLFVFWRRRFAGNIRGRSTWWTDRAVGYTRGEMEIAVSPGLEWRPNQDLVRVITMHEIGHLIGLRHVDDPSSVMSRILQVTSLPARDVQRARALYGSLTTEP